MLLQEELSTPIPSLEKPRRTDYFRGSGIAPQEDWVPVWGSSELARISSQQNDVLPFAISDSVLAPPMR